MLIDGALAVPPWLTIPAALALDLMLGDPHGWPHPVRWMGRAISWFEPVCRKTWKNERWAGAFFAVVLIAASWAIAFGIVKAMEGVHPVLGFWVETVLIYYCLSIRSLMDAAMEIHGLLVRGEIDSARHKLSWIVSRDVDRYQGEDIARATVETVAENFVDGVLSPLFFTALGGAPLAVAYKMINTLDSMVGYKNERYIRFGTVAACIDDAANYLPARLSVAVIALATQLLSGRHGRRAFQTALEEGGQHISPNAGYPEASFAGALAVRLNGPNYYHGRLVHKPYIGIAFDPVAIGHIPKACQLMLVASFLGVLLFSVLLCIAGG
ncbi:MAG: adenosylcobinamide-phosphate synthase CbiB [Desulfatitalea sp.]